MVCSQECKDAWQAARRELARQGHLTCVHCGGAYKPKAADRVAFCSRDCAFAYRRERPKRRAAKPKLLCTICTNPFEGRRGRRYCSDECRGEAARRKSRQRYQTLNPKSPRRCMMCGALFVPGHGSQTRCSDLCVKNAEKRSPGYKAAKADQNRRRRARLRGAKVQRVRAMEIYKRDRWTCQLCHRRVNRRLNHPHPLSATLDHIISLAEGGAHDPGNVQLAHLMCNSNKRERSRGQMRLLV